MYLIIGIILGLASIFATKFLLSIPKVRAITIDQLPLGNHEVIIALIISALFLLAWPIVAPVYLIGWLGLYIYTKE